MYRKGIGKGHRVDDAMLMDERKVAVAVLNQRSESTDPR